LHALLGLVILGCLGQVVSRQFDHPGLRIGRQLAASNLLSQLLTNFILLLSPAVMAEKFAFCDLRCSVSASIKPSCTPGPLEWLDDRLIGFISQTDPEVRNHVVFDIQTGTAAQYPGYWFKWSPDHKTLADVKLTLSLALLPVKTPVFS
jgi:hypothetical protein